jgi:two-component system sensor histidine kinase PilS (NtrC family)
MGARDRAGTDSSYGLLRVYSYYRFALSLLLLVMYFALRRADIVEFFLPSLYIGTAVPYALLNLLTLVLVLRRPRDPRPRHVFAMLVLDIAALVLVTHASGGVNSGFAVLLMVTVAAAAVFVRGQVATLVAAVASLAVLSEAVFLMAARASGVGTLFSAGVLGMLLFLSSLLVQRLAARLESSQELALEKSGEVIELQRLNQLIIERMRTGILFIDANDRVRIANQAALQLLGLGDTGDRRLPAPVARALAQWRADPWQAIAPLRIEDGGPLVQLAFTRIQAASGDGTLVFAEDFTQVAQQAQQLKLVSLGRLTASIAHEIRNPLGSISHAAQLLRESPQLPAEDQRLVDIVLGNSRRTNEVIESVLTLSRGHQPRPERIRLRAWLQRFVDELQLRGSGELPRVRVEVAPEETEVSVDPTHLRQILHNLCENGLRYSLRETGAATLLLRAATDPDTGLSQLDVVDQGPGIAAADSASIFEPFFTTEVSGTGLGLYLSRELCEANQIRLEYRREPGAGSCFRLNFPHPDRRAITRDATQGGTTRNPHARSTA